MLSRLALTTRQPLLRQAFPLSTGSGTVDGKLTLKITRSDQVPAARWQELDAIEAGFQEQLLRLTLRAFVIVLPLVTGHASSTPNEFFSCILVIQGFLTFLFCFSSLQDNTEMGRNHGFVKRLNKMRTWAITS